MPAPLNNDQKRILAMLAKEAWMAAIERGHTCDEETFRHDQCEAAVGKRGACACNQDDYAGLMAHFHGLLGHAKEVFYWTARASGNDRRVAWFKLQGELTRTGTHVNYVSAICARQFRCGLTEASAKQIWSLFYTVRNRAAAKARKPAEAAA